MTKEALALALEALEEHHYGVAQIIIREALAQPVQEPYDQTALELCEVCGWKTLIPTDGCLNCERKAKPEQCPWVGLTMDELATLVVKTVGYPIKLAQEIEAKLKEINS